MHSGAWCKPTGCHAGCKGTCALQYLWGHVRRLVRWLLVGELPVLLASLHCKASALRQVEVVGEAALLILALLVTWRMDWKTRGCSRNRTHWAAWTPAALVTGIANDCLKSEISCPTDKLMWRPCKETPITDGNAESGLGRMHVHVTKDDGWRACFKTQGRYNGLCNKVWGCQESMVC